MINHPNMMNTAMVICNIEKEYFDAYRVEEDDIIAVTMMDLQKTLKKFESFKRLKIELAKDEAKLKFFAQDGKRRKRSSLKLVEIPEEYSAVSPDINYPIILRINSKEFRQSLQDCYEIASDEPLTIKMKDGNLIVSVETDMASNEDTWKVGEDLQVLLADEATSLVPIDEIFNTVNKSYSISDDITLSIKEDFPLTFTYSFDHGNMRFIIAPRLL